MVSHLHSNAPKRRYTWEPAIIREVQIPPMGLPGIIHVPGDAYAAVSFAHGSGSSRFSPPLTPCEPEASLAQQRLNCPHQRVPVDADRPLALTPLDQHLEALDRYVEFQRLHPVHRDPQRIVVSQIVELCPVLALDGGNPHGFAAAVGFGFLAVGAGQAFSINDPSFGIDTGSPF